MIDDQIEVTPGLKLSLPVSDCGQWGYHQEWTSDTSILGDLNRRHYPNNMRGLKTV